MSATNETDRQLLARARVSTQRLLAELRRDAPAITDARGHLLIDRLETSLKNLQNQLEKAAP